MNFHGTAYTPGQLAEIQSALVRAVPKALELLAQERRNPMSPKDVVKLCRKGELVSNYLSGMFQFLAADYTTSQKEHVIDCDKDPMVPDGWKVEKHVRGMRLRWNTTQFKLHLSDNQKGSRMIEGETLRNELAGKSVLNANVLDYLLAHPHLIPEEWKKGAAGNTPQIFFWGTIYRESRGNLCVRCLCWAGREWGWYKLRLDDVFRSSDPALVSVGY